MLEEKNRQSLDMECVEEDKLILIISLYQISFIHLMSQSIVVQIEGMTYHKFNHIMCRRVICRWCETMITIMIIFHLLGHFEMMITNQCQPIKGYNHWCLMWGGKFKSSSYQCTIQLILVKVSQKNQLLVSVFNFLSK